MSMHMFYDYTQTKQASNLGKCKASADSELLAIFSGNDIKSQSCAVFRFLAKKCATLDTKDTSGKNATSQIYEYESKNKDVSLQVLPLPSEDGSYGIEPTCTIRKVKEIANTDVCDKKMTKEDVNVAPGDMDKEFGQSGYTLDVEKCEHMHAEAKLINVQGTHQTCDEDSCITRTHVEHPNVKNEAINECNINAIRSSNTDGICSIPKTKAALPKNLHSSIFSSNVSYEKLASKTYNMMEESQAHITASEGNNDLRNTMLLDPTIESKNDDTRSVIEVPDKHSSSTIEHGEIMIERLEILNSDVPKIPMPNQICYADLTEMEQVQYSMYCCEKLRKRRGGNVFKRAYRWVRECISKEKSISPQEYFPKKTIPSYLYALFEHVENKGTESQGIFRLNGHRYDELIMKLVKGHEVDLNEYGIDAVATALKLTIRDRLNGLLPSQPCRTLLRLARKPIETGFTNEYLPFIVPPEDKAILERFFRLMGIIDMNKGTTLMPVSNILKVAVPSLLPPDGLQTYEDAKIMYEVLLGLYKADREYIDCDRYNKFKKWIKNY